MTDEFLGRPSVADFHTDSPRAIEPKITGFAAGDCLYLQESDNDNAWLEGRAVCLGDME
jgi:hypothetical protein